MSRCARKWRWPKIVDRWRLSVSRGPGSQTRVWYGSSRYEWGGVRKGAGWFRCNTRARARVVCVCGDRRGFAGCAAGCKGAGSTTRWSHGAAAALPRGAPRAELGRPVAVDELRLVVRPRRSRCRRRRSPSPAARRALAAARARTAPPRPRPRGRASRRARRHARAADGRRRRRRAANTRRALTGRPARTRRRPSRRRAP